MAKVIYSCCYFARPSLWCELNSHTCLFSQDTKLCPEYESNKPASKYHLLSAYRYFTKRVVQRNRKYPGWFEILQKSDYACAECGSINQLEMHSSDHNWRFLCRTCHELIDPGYNTKLTRAQDNYYLHDAETLLALPPAERSALLRR